jgi:hypothetical protein
MELWHRRAGDARFVAPCHAIRRIGTTCVHGAPVDG